MTEEKNAMNMHLKDQSDYVTELKGTQKQLIQARNEYNQKIKYSKQSEAEKFNIIEAKGNLLKDLVVNEKATYKLNENKPAHQITQTIARKIEKRQINMNTSLTRGSPSEVMSFMSKMKRNKRQYSQTSLLSSDLGLKVKDHRSWRKED